MNEGTKISDHLNVMNGIISELKAIGVKIEDNALRFIWSFPPFYEHMKFILVHGKETVVFSEITSKCLSEERKLTSGGSNVPSEGSALVVDTKKKNSMKTNIICWGVDLGTRKEIIKKVERVRLKAPNLMMLILSLMIETMILSLDHGW